MPLHDSGKTEASEKTLQHQAYNAATKRLREAHQEEFNTLRTEESKKLGLDWKPKPTALQRAEFEMEGLLAAHPELLDKIAERVSQRSTPDHIE